MFNPFASYNLISFISLTFSNNILCIAVCEAIPNFTKLELDDWLYFGRLQQSIFFESTS